MKFILPLLFLTSFFSIAQAADIQLGINVPIVVQTDYAMGDKGEINIPGNWFLVRPQVFNNSGEKIVNLTASLEVRDGQGTLLHRTVISHPFELDPSEGKDFTEIFVSSLPKNSTIFNCKLSIIASTNKGIEPGMSSTVEFETK